MGKTDLKYYRLLTKEMLEDLISTLADKSERKFIIYPDITKHPEFDKAVKREWKELEST